MTMSGHPDSSSEQRRIPGVTYRTEYRTRHVPHTINGVTKLLKQEYTVEVPVPPRDWDQTIINGVTTVAMAFTLVSVTWSAVSGGNLLARTASEYIAYPSAVAADLLWLCCQALEWVNRYDPERAWLPRRIGYGALVLAMAVITVHGALLDELAAGLAGATVTLAAKGLWVVVLRHHARPLPELTRLWLRENESEATARLALAGQLRALARVEAEAALFAPPQPQTIEARPTADVDEMSGLDVRTVQSAVRAAATAMPDATLDSIIVQLAAAGIVADEDTVRTILDTGTDTQDSSSQPPVQPIAPPSHSISESVRTALAAGITDPDKVLSYTRRLHGQQVREDTVARIIRRIAKAS
ncbi:hypothetical protein ACIQGT_14125 [Streptomyces sp. NPDC093108]|uniref:hypothetical protein n=1 Tax=Streptomyces sp. NPDC093108 TaxID=3366030 RepID=UPI00382A9AAD